ncbi:poly [ADP-ribose] polymerase 1-like isoform X2 [Dysidea avara]|uniref:poly [ADP-ribose] polymerase 1-like isoform X2 n=1 Tax=Dysidea avara TaxID=196820 RepID=UPI00332CB510
MASQELPYRAEYAKSGRASCKACKGLISKDILRMAHMVQSSHFDGKVPNWYHFSCFFKKFRVKATSDVAHFDSLRWDDQKKIEGHCTGGGGTLGGGAAAEPKGSAVQEMADLQVEYSKSSRATCRGCDEKIEIDEVRIAKMVEPDAAEYGHVAAAIGLMPRWHHVDCFIQAMFHLGVSGITANHLTGFSKLKKPDREILTQKLGGSVTKKAKSRKRIAVPEETAPAAKKSKSASELEDEKKLKEQNGLVWKIRDGLSRSLKTSGLRTLLEANRQGVPSGESKMLDRCSDGMAFGALRPCPECGGQLAYIGHCYCCTGNLTAWTKCTYWTRSPDRKAWHIPDDLQEDHPYLNSFRFKPRERYFSPTQLPNPSNDSTDGAASASSSSKIDGNDVAPSTSSLPLASFNFLLQGKPKSTKKGLTEMITELGGTITTTINYKVGLCIIPDGDDSLEKLSERTLAQLEEKQIPVVGESFITGVKEKGKLVPILDHLLSSWGQSKVKSMDKFGGQVKEEKSKFKSSGKSFGKSFGPEFSRVKKFAVKGGAVVDPESGLERTHHVYEVSGVVYNAVLGMVDIQRGSNSYYKLQILESDAKSHYLLFRSWGRVGTSIGGNKLEDFGRISTEAIAMFEELYLSKTGNMWGNVKNFVKYPNKFYPLEIDYGQGDDDLADRMVTAGSTSQLVPEIQNLIKMIFDVDRMKNVLLEFEIDVNKMPLGKLSRKQIDSAYLVLTEALEELQGDKNPNKLLDASNRFYTLIPHDFGMQSPPLLDDEEFIKVLSKDCDEFEMIKEYVTNTHAPTHSSYALELLEVFNIERHGESKRYKPFRKLPNRKLLWHGSRTTNFAGILSQGLRIAPPEAPVTGYMFGKGVYFADMASKSANYCFTSRSKNVGLVLLCEVALGNICEKTHAENVTKLPQGKHSVKGLGNTQPDPAGTRILDGGVEVPMGTSSSSSVSGTSLLYNEYIVYDVAQINMKYLLKLKFCYK